MPLNPVAPWDQVREEFPSIRNWTYLNTATLGLIPRRARAAVDAHLQRRDDLANTDFSDWWDDADRLRATIASLLNGVRADDIAFFPNASAALALAATAIDWQPGDRILTLTDEFPNQFYFASRFPGVELIECSPERFLDAAGERTRMVALSTVSYQTGFRAPWEEWIPSLRARGIVTYVDATQSFGALVTRLQGHAPDMLSVNCYKWACAPTGAAFAYIHPEFRERLVPTVVGWRSDAGWRDMANLRHGPPVFSSDAEKYEGGMLPFPSLYGLQASLELMLEIGPDQIEQRILNLARACGGDGSSNIVTLDVPGRDAVQVASNLKNKRIVVSARRGRLRISPHFFNNEADIAHFQDAMRSG